MTQNTRSPVPVAVIGLGAVMPDANDLQAFWHNIRTGKSSIREVPANRWRLDDFYDPDPKAPDKTYTKIGAWISDFEFDSLKYRIPPKVAEAMDNVQKWAIESARQALEDSGYLEKEFDRNRTAVVIGNAMAGELQFITNLRIYFPRYLRTLRDTEAFRSLPEDLQEQMASQFKISAVAELPPITEDSMPGELSNVIAGRVANVFGLRGPNYTADAACASSLAALEASLTGLAENRYDMVLTGGTDSSMSPHSFVKFSKIGALSAELSSPFDQRANGFVMGEGCGILLLKRLADAERDGDRVYAVIHGLGSSSDGKGKGITAPNPVGQRLALERAYQSAGISPASVGMIEAHGTSTIAGDMVEGNLACEFYSAAGAKPGSIAMGSVKSQIGHLKSSAGAASLIKAVLCIHEGVIPASLNFENPNPNIPFQGAPIYVPTQLTKWKSNGIPRTAGVSAFGFGGTNFHAVLGEYRPDRSDSGETGGNGGNMKDKHTNQSAKPERRMLAVGAQDSTGLSTALKSQAAQPPESDPVWPSDEVLSAPQRLVIDYGSPEEREKRVKRAQSALASDDPKIWRALSGQGVFRRSGKKTLIAFVFPGQGSQYIGMLKDLRESEPLVAETFAEADRIMEPILGKPLTEFIYTDDTQENKEALRDTNVCQPAMLAADIALTKVLAKHGIQPDMVAGHSLGEYAALVVAGMLSYSDAMYAVSARAREMSNVLVDDCGKMAAVIAPFDQMMEVIKDIDNLAPANFNCPNQTVIAGGSAAIDEAMRRMQEAGIRAVQLQVSHAFHSHIVAPATGPLRKLLGKLNFQPPKIPLIANVDAKPYDDSADSVESNLDRLSQQIASPVRWAESLRTMYGMGARTFIEVGAKRVLTNFVLDVLDDPDVMSVASNHPKLGDWPSLGNALAACAAAGGARTVKTTTPPPVTVQASATEIVVSGASIGLPGVDHPVFDDANLDRVFEGKTCIDPIPEEDRQRMIGQRIVRLVKDAPGGPAFVVIDSPEEVVQLSGRKGKFDLVEEFGLDPERVASYDITTQLAIGAGLLALKDAGIPLVMHHRTATTGKKLPTGFRLPEQLADETGIIFASAFPGYDKLIQEMNRRQEDLAYESRILELKRLAQQVGPLHAIGERIAALEEERGQPWGLNRKFIFQALNMGHAQFAELIGARGPNIGVNGACASTTQAMIIASDWVRSGRCRRVLVVAADDVTNSNLSPWIVGGLLATGAVTKESKLEEAALPFDRRRNGMITGMGAVGLVIEDAREAQKRGMLGLTRLLGSAIANSAFHGTRLNVNHISQTMENLVSRVEQEQGLDRKEIAKQTVFVSHETYTPARGGSASAEVHALRQTFGDDLDNIVIANTKGFTGHPMAVGIEDGLAIRMLERQAVPPIPNHKEQDPELGQLNLSKGGHYDLRYALRLSAGFGSQLAMTLTEKIDNPGNRLVDQARQQAWLDQVTGIQDAALEVVHNTLRVKDNNRTTPAEAETKPVEPPPPPAIEEPKPMEAPPSVNSSADSSTEAAQAAEVDPEDIQGKILSIVSEKTGYPVEMLDLDLDLEADLGIDTVKQAEMFSEIRAAYNIPKQDDLKLSEYPTLNHVIGFAKKNMGKTTEISEPIQEPEPKVEEPAPATDVSDIQEKILSIVSDKTGYPVEMLDLDLDLEADLGIDTVKQAEMFSEIRATFNIPKQDDLKLSEYPTLNHVIGFARDKMGQPTIPAPIEQTVAEPDPTPQESTTDLDGVQEKILSIVSDKTGYPVEMLELDLDLEADLGIDTVKQAEMFSEIRAAYNIPKQDDLRLSEYPTLAKVIQFAKDRIGGTPAEQVATEVIEADSEPAAVSSGPSLPREDPGPEPISSVTAESESVRFLAPVLVGRPPASECLGTGAKVNGRTFIIGDYNGAAEALQLKLKALGGEAIRVADDRDPDAVAAEVKRLAEEAPPAGIWILSALGAPVLPGGPDLDAWRRALDQRARMPFRLAKVLDSVFSENAGTFFLAATRMGGHLGLGNGSGAYDPAAGATTGLVKALSHEWTKTVCKVVDLPRDADAQMISLALIEEAEYDRGVTEIGHSSGGRWGVGLSEFQPLESQEAVPGKGCLPETDPVVLVTGGAGDIVGQITTDLTRHCKGTYYLADLTPAPAEDDPDLKALAEDRDALKLTLAERLKKAGERVTPVRVEQALRGLERQAAALESLHAVRQAGGEAHHVSVDVTDVQAVSEVIKKIVDTHGRLDLVLHAAGLEHSQGVAKKKPEAFDKILGVKVDGLNALLAATRDVPLRGLMLFGSVAGRFGNAGQTDYSAANDLMSKCTTYLKRSRPGLQVFTLDYSGWGGRGMATRGSIPDQLAAAGITLIPLEEGACSVRRVFASSYSGELVVACSLGILADSLRSEGVNLEIIRQRLSTESNRFPLLGEVQDWTLADGLRLEVSFDPEHDHYLNDHRIDGTAVLPGVMAVETFAEAANLMHPELSVVSVEDLAFEAPLKLYRNEPRTATVRLLPTWGKQGRVILATMETTRELVGGRKQTTRHFRARVRLDQDLPLVKGEPPGNGTTKDIRREAIYQAYFHGPSFQVLNKVTTSDDGKIAGWMQSGTELPPLGKPGNLMSQPMFTELAFQAAGIVEANQSQKLGLPAGVRRMKIHQSPEGDHGQVTAWVVPERNNGATQYDIRVVNERGFVLLELDGYRTSPLPNALPADVQTGLAPKKV